MNTENLMQDKELFNDMLTSQKQLTANYSLFANECSSKNLRSDMLKILTDEHTIQAQLFDEMQTRGWYQTQPAEQQKIDAAKTKYSPYSNS